MTTSNEVRSLKSLGWILTDASTNQMYKEILKDKVYMFREDRIINPDTKETEVFEAMLEYDDYNWGEIVNACKTFGYTSEQVDKWITEGEEIPLMLECIFELM